MNLYVHIERLILDGLHLTSGQAAGVQAAVETELARLLAEVPGEISPALRTGGAMSSVRANAISLPDPGAPAQVGGQIAATLAHTLAAETSQSFGRQGGLPSPQTCRSNHI